MWTFHPKEEKIKTSASVLPPGWGAKKHTESPNGKPVPSENIDIISQAAAPPVCSGPRTGVCQYLCVIPILMNGLSLTEPSEVKGSALIFLISPGAGIGSESAHCLTFLHYANQFSKGSTHYTTSFVRVEKVRIVLPFYLDKVFQSNLHRFQSFLYWARKLNVTIWKHAQIPQTSSGCKLQNPRKQDPVPPLKLVEGGQLPEGRSGTKPRVQLVRMLANHISKISNSLRVSIVAMKHHVSCCQDMKHQVALRLANTVIQCIPTCYENFEKMKHI